MILPVNSREYFYITICIVSFCCIRPQKTLKELSEESGLSLDMLGCMTQVMSRHEAALTFKAISFMPPVTFLRINTLKVLHSSPLNCDEQLHSYLFKFYSQVIILFLVIPTSSLHFLCELLPMLVQFL